MGTRDFPREMDLIIERHTSVDTYQTRIIAQDIVTELLADDPDLLNGWLQIKAADLLHEVINHRDRSRRARGVHERRQQDFNEVLDDFVAGRTEPLRSFLGTMHAVDRDNNRKKLRNMNRHDLEFRADEHKKIAQTNGYLSAFYRALAKRVGDQTVGDVFSEAQIQAMRAQFTGTDD